MTDRLTAEDAARLRDAIAVALYNHGHPRHRSGPVPHGYYDMTDAVLPALAAALADSVPRAEHEAEVTRLREALDELVESIDAFLTGERKTDRVMPERMRTAYLHSKAALAEGSDVLPTQRDH